MKRHPRQDRLQCPHFEVELFSIPGRKSRLATNNMTFSWSLICLVLLTFEGLQLASAQGVKPPATLSELRQRLGQHISHPKYEAAVWGLKIISLETGKILFEHNPQKLFSPASNTKLFTVALALDVLGPEHPIKTSFYSLSKVDATGTLGGDLLIVGRGDPYIGSGDLQTLVHALTNAGIRRINGDLIGDESYFRGPAFGSGWVWEDTEHSYGAELSALSFNNNLTQIVVTPGKRIGDPCRLAFLSGSGLVISNESSTVANGRALTVRLLRPFNNNLAYVLGEMPLGHSSYTFDVTIHNPALWFLTALKDALARNGTVLAGKVRTLNWLPRHEAPECDQMVELGTLHSARTGDVSKDILKHSVNLYANLLLAIVGEQTRSSVPDRYETSEQLGIRALTRFLLRAGVRKEEVLFEEGSGLSRNNLTTPNAIVALLRFMERHRYAEAYLQGLPVAGVDGTLQERMKGTPAQGNVRAKTGTLRWGNALSGHVTTAAGERLVFALMLNRFQNTETNRPAHGDLDTIAVWLAGFTGHSDETER